MSKCSCPSRYFHHEACPYYVRPASGGPVEAKPEAIITPGGWCAPSWVEYPASDPGLSIEFPTISVQRGPANEWFPAPGTPEFIRQQFEHEQAQTVQRYVLRLVGDVMKAQHEVLDAACLTALHEGYDVWVHRHGYKATRFIGIELAPRTNGRIFPTVHETTDDWRWEEED